MIRSNGGIERMRAILAGVGGMSAADAAQPVDGFMRSQLAAGETPEGEAWKPTKDGRKPLQGAAAAYEQRLSGNAIILKIGGAGKKRYVIHNFGAGDQPVRRQLPAGTMPPKLGQAIRAGLVSDFVARTRGGRMGYSALRAGGVSPRSRAK